MRKTLVFLPVILAFCVVVNLVYSGAARAAGAKSVTLTVSEKSVGDALGLALRLAAKKNLNADGPSQKAIMDAEVIPHASQYISSYKVISGGGGRSWINVSATIDLSALQSILILNSAQFKKSPVKLLVLVRGFKGGAPWKGVAYEESELQLVDRIEAEVKKMAQRRQLTMMPRISSYQEHIENVDVNSSALLRAVALRADADLVLFVDSKFQQVDDDEAIVEGLQLQLETALYERGQNLVLANSKESVPMAAGEKALTSKSEKVYEIVDTLIDKATHDVFMRAGGRFLAENAAEAYLTLRVLDPPNHAAVAELKDSVQKIAKVNSVIEREVERGRLDFWVDAGFGQETLRKELRALQLENYRVSVRQPSEETAPEIVLVRLEPKTGAAGGKE